MVDEKDWDMERVRDAAPAMARLLLAAKDAGEPGGQWFDLEVFKAACVETLKKAGVLT